MSQRFGWPVFGRSGGPDNRPKFTRGPSISPSSAPEGSVFEIDPGEGPSLMWTLFLDDLDVTADVTAGEWFGDAGDLLLRSRIEADGQSRSAAASATVTVAAVAPPDWQVDGGENRVTILTMPTPATLPVTGGENLITIGAA